MTKMFAKLFVIITVDTEDSQGLAPNYNDAFQELRYFVYGELNKDYYGFPKIMEICDKYDCKATFFVSVFDCGKYGKSATMEVCKLIRQNRHDIQLHTHPRRVYDKDKREMYLYSLDEQIEMVKDGKELIREWTGEVPIAYRAGAYGINEDTFIALRKNAIPIDSSSFYSHPHCKAVITKNKIVEYDGIIEVPVTIFQRNRRISLGNWVLKRQSKFIKTDIGWASLDELKWFVQQAKENDIKVMTLFMHSYSFLKFDTNFTKFEPNWGDIDKFDKFLSFVANDAEIKVITMKDFFEIYQKDPEQFIGSDYVPVVESNETPLEYGTRRAKSIVKRLIKSS